MGGLRPIGSEKLSGMDKIRRIIEIATYDNKGSNLNEDKENVFSVKLADNIDYVIVKEKNGYIIKESFNGEVNYLENIQERKYYKSYSQALKRLNLVAKEKNTLYENKKGTPLFEESEKKKYYLDLGSKKKEETKSETTPQAPVGTTPTTPPPAGSAPPVGTTPTTPPPAGAAPPLPLEEQGDPTLEPTAPPLPVPTGAAPPLPAPTGAETPPLPDAGLEGGEGMEPTPEEEMDMEPEEGGEDKKEEITFKLIQKLTGKLAQKLRSYGEDKEMSSDNIKYVINSIISAIDVEALDEEDIEEIINRLEGEDEEEGMEDEMDMETEEEPMGGMGPEPGLEGPPPAPEGALAPPAGEMAEGFKNLSDAFVNKFKGAYSSVLADKMMEGQRRDKRRKKHSYSENIGESTVDKIISKYFDIKEDEYLIKEEEVKKEIEFIKRKNTQEIKRLSESLRQERMALKFIEKYPKAKLIGSTTKKNLVFKQGLTEKRITPEGKVL